MLAILLIWLYIFIVTSVAGLLLKISLFNTSKFQENPIILSVTGYCLITGLLSIISLFYKISLEANVFIVLLEILGIVFYKKQFIESFNSYLSKLKSLNSRQYLVFFVVVFNVLLLNIKSVHTDSDTGLYHAQAIQWIEKYPVVPGLANLFANYGFNSSSFISDAFFSFTFIHNFPYYALNSFFVLILVLFGISNIKKEDNNYLVYITLVILNYFFYRGDMSLPFPDILISCTETFIFFVFLEKIKEKSLDQFDFKSVTITFLALTCITGKLSALPVILSLLLVIIYSFSNLRIKQWLIIFSTGFFIVVPWLIRNVITSGYLIFPYPSIDLFNVDWKVPLSEALIAKSWIVSHARVFVQMDVFNMSFAEWFPIWLRNQNKIDLLLLLISISGMCLFFITTLLSKPIRKKIVSPLFYFGLTFFLSIICWFLMAPGFRFGYAYIFVCIAILISLSIKLFSPNHYLFRGFAVGILIVFGAYCCIWPSKLIASGEVSLRKHFLNPELKYKPISFVTVSINGVNFFMPKENKRSWNQDIPCTPRLYNSLQLRGDNLGDGFRIPSVDSITVSPEGPNRIVY